MTQVYLRSLKGIKNDKHVLGEVDNVIRLSDGKFIAVKDGKHYSAIYNPFVGSYFVDDVDGLIPRMITDSTPPWDD